VQFHFVDAEPIDRYLRFSPARCEAQPGCIDQPTVAGTTPGATWLAISSGARLALRGWQSRRAHSAASRRSWREVWGSKATSDC
jgi:hypothetical protein